MYILHRVKLTERMLQSAREDDPNPSLSCRTVRDQPKAAQTAQCTQTSLSVPATAATKIVGDDIKTIAKTKTNMRQYADSTIYI